MDTTHLTTKELPSSERPYERFEKYGAEILSDAELLAVIIKTGSKKERAVEVAQRILNCSTTHKGILGLNYLTINELMDIRGIGRVKAIQLLCVAELSKRMSKAVRETGLSLMTPFAIADYYMQEMRHWVNEKVMLLMMDAKNKLIKDMVLTSGTVNSSILSPREVYINALKYSAVYIILIHNHPSGDPTPSAEDINSTKRIREVGALIGIMLMDHIVIGDNNYVSFRERGILEGDISKDG